jgi:selenocysteine lyase/cysteine desulfurase
VSLAVADLPVSVVDKLSRHKIMAAGGNFYAWRLCEALGINPGHGVLRFSFTHYTTPAEITRLIEALDAELK